MTARDDAPAVPAYVPRDPVEAVATALPDITSREDIEAMVTEFYRAIFADELLGPIFIDVAHVNIEAHLPTMFDFWETLLLRANKYRRSPMPPHAAVHSMEELRPELFARWLSLWDRTVDARHAGTTAEAAKNAAHHIAQNMSNHLNGGY